MSNFLEKAKQNANEVINKQKAQSPLSNPFVNNSANVINKVKPSMPKPPVPGIPSIPKGGLPKPPAGKPMPPIGNIPKAAPKVEPKVEEPVKTVEPKVEESVKVEQPVKANEVTPKVEPKVEEPKKEEVKKEEPKKEEVKEEKKKTTAKTSKSKKKTAAKETHVSEDNETITIPKTTLNYAEAITAIMPKEDEEFVIFKEEWKKKETEIVIPSQPTKPQLNDLLSQVSILRDEISFIFNDTKNLYEHLTLKDKGLIDIVEKSGAKGANAEERKINAMNAAMNYKYENENINLYELLSVTRSKYNFIKTIVDSLEFKKSILLTELSSLKNEK